MGLKCDKLVIFIPVFLLCFFSEWCSVYRWIHTYYRFDCSVKSGMNMKDSIPWLCLSLAFTGCCHFSLQLVIYCYLIQEGGHTRLMLDFRRWLPLSLPQPEVSFLQTSYQTMTEGHFLSCMIWNETRYEEKRAQNQAHGRWVPKSADCWGLKNLFAADPTMHLVVCHKGFSYPICHSNPLAGIFCT